MTVRARILPRVAIALLASAPGAILLRGWLVDDAAISYSYASNMVNGAGLVAQAGRVPVEGFSNPLWVLILASAAWLPTVDPRWVMKCFDLLFTTAFLCVAGGSLARRGISTPTSSLLLIVLALQPPLAIWSNSGLETPLLLFCLLAFAESLVLLVRGSAEKSPLQVGVLATACALARPEAITYGLASLALLTPPSPAPGNRRGFTHTRYAIILALAVATFLASRVVYFHDWLPNTFYAKGGLTFSSVVDTLLLGPHTLQKAGDLASSVAGAYGAAPLFLVSATLVLSAVWRQRLSSWSLVYLAFTTVSVLNYLLLPSDWMGEYRYGTPAILLFWMTCAHLAKDLWPAEGGPNRTHAFAALCIAVSGAASFNWIPRIVEFHRSPALPLSEVTARALAFDNAARVLGLYRPAILTQDVGGFLLHDRLSVYDMGMLTDQRIAYALGEWREEPDYRDFQSYVLDEIRPAFISVTAYHAWRGKLSEDPRFERDYRPVRSTLDLWVLNRYGRVMESGDYVRRDTIRSEDQVEVIRKLLQAANE